MAPEQVQGKPRPASDQYALGVVVYEWLCGNRPFQTLLANESQSAIRKPGHPQGDAPTIYERACQAPGYSRDDPCGHSGIGRCHPRFNHLRHSPTVSFQGSFTEVATQQVLAPPPPLREKISTISPAIEEVVMKTLVKDPHQRFASIQEFAAAFEKACHAPLSFSQPTPSNQYSQTYVLPTIPPKLFSPPPTNPAMSPPEISPSPAPGRPCWYA